MSQQFYNISGDEMNSFLSSLGFRQMAVTGTVELVYGKVLNLVGHKISLRVYTAIWPTGQSREKGKDAIRVMPYILHDKQAVCIGSITVKRVKSWKSNLAKAIGHWSDSEHWKLCPACGWPFVLKHGRNGLFWGCSTWAKTKCDGRTAPQEQVAASEKESNNALWHKLMGGGATSTTVATLPPPAPPARPTPKTPKTRNVVNPHLPGEFDRDESWEFPSDPLNAYRLEPSKISTFQKEAETLFRTADRHLLLPSRAGGGKTRLLKHLATFRPQEKRFAYLTFGRKNAAKAKTQFPRGTWCMTTHSFLMQSLREHFGSLPEKTTDAKDWIVLNDIYPVAGSNDVKKQRKRIQRATLKMVGYAKNYACRPGDVDRIKSVMDRYTFVLDSDQEHNVVVELTNQVLELSRPGAKFGTMFNYDDMLWWWVILNLEPRFFHVALLDEVQDFNACQLEMVERMMQRGTRIVAVGDAQQAVMRFRGADNEAFDKMTALLNGDKRGCDRVFLPVNYRCGKRILEYVVAETVVKDIVPAPDAIEGEVFTELNYDEILDMICADFAA